MRVQDAFIAVGQLISVARTFDLIIADPPFGEKNINRRSQSFSQQLLDNVSLPQLLRAGGLLLLGHSKRDQLTLPLHWHERKLLKHGDSLFRFLEAVDPGQGNA